jgi:tetratricopeptide (TPR) repeat protein
MPLRKSLFLVSITALGVSAAFAQQLGNPTQTVAGLSQTDDPFAAPAPRATDANGLDGPTGFDFGQAPAATVPAAPQTDAFGAAPASAASPVLAPSNSASGANPFAASIPAPGMARAAPAVSSANPFAMPAASAPAQAPASTGAAFSLDEPKATDGAGGGAKPVDETALRYYASQRDLVRVGAEIRRLKSLHSGWQPPRDLFAPVNTVDEQPLWDLYSKGAYAEVRRGIERLKAETPTYVPSSDLVAKVEDGEVRQVVRQAASRNDWTGAIAAAQARPSLLVCSNMDVLWTVGESFARLRNMAKAYDLYAYVLNTCEVPAERLATFQKAAALLPPEGINALVALGRSTPDGHGEFDSLRFDGLRKAMAEASTSGGPLPASDELTAYANFVRASRSASDMSQIGWYFFGQQNWDRAAEWFRASMDAGGDAKSTEGYLLALRNGGAFEDAERLGFRSYRLSPDIAKVYVEMISEALTDETSEAKVTPEMRTRFERVVTDAKSPLGAQALGWSLLAEEKPREGQDWFKRSVDWKPTEEGVIGLAVAATRLKDKAEVKRIRAEYEADFPGLSDFSQVETRTASAKPSAGVTTKRGPDKAVARKTGKKSGGSGSGGGDKLMREANRLFQAGDYEGSLAALDQREAKRGKAYDAEMLRGWANHKLHRWDKARAAFQGQDKIRSTRDTRFGIGATTNSQYRTWSETQNNCTKWGKC